MRNAKKVFFLYSWLVPFFREGSKRDLQLEDLYRVSAGDKSKRLGDDLNAAWEKQMKKANLYNKSHRHGKTKTPSLHTAIVKVFFWRYMLLGFFAFFEECIIRYV